MSSATFVLHDALISHMQPQALPARHSSTPHARGALTFGRLESRPSTFASSPIQSSCSVLLNHVNQYRLHHFQPLLLRVMHSSRQ